ncbi:MAG: efflux RND transporter periplasmic adaptor subunit [bacterium]
MEKLKSAFGLIGIAIIVVIIAGCNGNDENIIDESGTIEATEIVISSQVAGKIEKILKDEGAAITAGDTLILLDTESLNLQHKQAAALRDVAKAQYDLLLKGARKEDIQQASEGLNQAETNYKLAKTDKERMENLFHSQSVTNKQLDDALARFDIAQAQYNSAKENLIKIKNIARPEEIAQGKANYERSEAALAIIEKSIRDCYVTSPISGFIVKQFAEEGESVVPMTSLIKVADLSNVEMSIYVSETDLGKVKLNQKVDVTVDSFADKKFEGKVIYISPTAEFTPKTIQTKDERTKLVFKVKVKIGNPNFELKAGMPADARIVVS